MAQPPVSATPTQCALYAKRQVRLVLISHFHIMADCYEVATSWFTGARVGEDISAQFNLTRFSVNRRIRES